MFCRYIDVYCTKFTGRKIKSVLQGKKKIYIMLEIVILNFTKG